MAWLSGIIPTGNMQITIGTFPLLALVRYLFSFTPINSYLIKCSWENIMFAIATGNVYVISYGVSLLAIPLLNLFIVH